MQKPLDDLDHQLMDLLRTNARLPVLKLAQMLDVSRTTVQERLKRLERNGVITGYTISTSQPADPRKVRAIVLIGLEPKLEHEVIRALSRRHQITELFSISGKYDLCALLTADSTTELDQVIDAMRATKGVSETFSTVILSTKLSRPD